MYALLESKRVWQMTTSQFQAQHGYTWDGIFTDVAPTIYKRLSKAQQRRRDAGRYEKSAKGQKLAAEYEKQVIDAYKRGEFEWKRNPKVSDDAKRIVLQHIRETEKAAKSKAAMDNMISMYDVEPGDRVYVMDRMYGTEGYGVVKKVYKSNVRVLIDGDSKPTRLRMTRVGSPFYHRKP
jgi:hypothetical protein